MAERPDVAVVIPARNAAASLAEAVDSALGQEGVGELEIVVAVGPSDDDTRAVARDCAEADPRVLVVDSPSGTTPAALNRAIAASSAPIVVRLDAHAVLPSGYIAMAVDVIHATGAANVGGRQVPVAAGGFAAAVAAAMTSPVGAGGATYRTGSTAGPADTVYLGTFRRDALEAVGGFDERLLRNQDYELNHRLRRAGHVVWFDPRLAVQYTPRASVGALARQYFDYGRWKRVVLRDHPDSVRLRQLAAPTLIITLLVAAVAGVWSWVPLLVVGGSYAALVLAAGLAADSRRMFMVALALAVMHLTWGVGFLLGGAHVRAGGPQGPSDARRGSGE